MKVITVKNQVEGGQVAFDILKEKLAAGAKTLGLATGSTPIELYKAMVASDLDFSELTSINLDEYVGLAPENDQSYRYFMNEHLFNHKPFKATYVPDGLAEDLVASTAAYDDLISANPIDVQVLGIGRNGHIGFNEPGTPFDRTTQVVDLAPSTIEANARFFESIDDVPRQAISMGIASILKSKTLLLLAFGEEKADAISKMVNGEVTTDLPASVLQTHDDVIVIVDEAAASLL